MEFLTAPLSSLSLLAIIYSFYILANLSRRYGDVIRLPPYYRGFYIGMALIGISFVSHLMRATVILDPQQGPALLSEDWFFILTYYLPLSLAVTIAIVISWRYWSWLLKDPDL